MAAKRFQVTDVKTGIREFEWSPDGSRLLLMIQDPTPAELTEDEEDDDKPQPHVIDRMQFKQDYVGYLDRRRNHVYVYTLGDDAPVQVTSGDFDDSDPVWSPDGKSIAFVSDRSSNADLNYGSDVWSVVVDDDNHPLTQVTTHAGRDYSPAWSPDSKSVAYITTSGPDIGGSALTPTRHLATTRVGQDERNVLTPDLDRNLSSPTFSDDGKTIYFRLEDEGQNHLATVDVDGENLERIIERQVNIGSFAIHGQTAVLTMGQTHQPSEVFFISQW